MGQALIITEIMADPTPSHGLPEKEYIELYNSSEKALSLNKFKLQYGSSIAQFPNVSIPAKSYVIVARKGNGEALQPFGSVIELNNFSLINTGTTLKLFDDTNKMVFSVTFSDKWYDPTRNQGNSLEMIDAAFSCVEDGNWTSSTDPQGGTPGRANAVAKSNPDTTIPTLERFEVLNSKLVKLVFSEKLDSNSVLHADFSFDNDLKIAQKKAEQPLYKNVLLSLSNELEDNELYNLSIKDIADCSGNLLREAHLTIGNLQPADSGDVVLNEILFNPRVGGEDFVEIFNKTDKLISIKDWNLANVDKDGNIDNIKPITATYFVLLPKQYLVLTKNVSKVAEQYIKSMKANFLEMSVLPSFPDDKGTVILMNQDQNIFDRLDYTEKMHHPLIDDPSGVSLEKIDVEKASYLPENWQSASANDDFATPGYANSQAALSEKVKNKFWFEPQVFTPDGDGIDEYTTLKYQLNESGNAANIRVFDVSGRLVKQLTQNYLLANSGEIIWDGKDHANGLVPVGYYVVLIEIFNPDGTTQVFKEKVVVGSKF